MHIGVQLRAYVLALETHRLCSLDSRWEEHVRRISTGVVSGVVLQLPIREHMQATGLNGWDERAPLVDCGPGNPQRPSDGSPVATEMLEGDSALHGASESTAVDQNVKRGRPGTISSGKQRFPLRYSGMAKPPRIKPTIHFNGDVIRQIREERRLTLDRLAEVIGTTKANISKWERSRDYIAISWDLFLPLAQALYVAPEELARRLSAPPPTSPAATESRRRRSR